MKKVFLILCAALLCLLFAGCDSAENAESVGENQSVVEKVSEENAVTVGVYEEVTDKIAVGTSPWKPEDITASPNDEEWTGISGGVMEGRLFFRHSTDKALLVGDSLTWLYSDDPDAFAPFNSGDYVKVSHGMVYYTYPGQTYISKIALIEDGDLTSFTPEEWEWLSEVFPNITVRYEDIPLVTEENVDFSEKDLSVVDRVIVTDGATGERVEVTDSADVARAVDVISKIKGEEPVSDRGYYGFSYHVELYCGDKEILSFTVCPEVEYTALICGYYETVGGFDYPARYRLKGCSYEDIDAVLKSLYQ